VARSSRCGGHSARLNVPPMLVVVAAIAVHLLALFALAFAALWMWRRLPDYDRSRDVILAMVIGLTLVAVMFALPHWGFGH
jgi:O-antigen/teichoic acid export membrane protein